MCFSASASFIAGSALTIAGVASVSQLKKPSHLLFSCIPLFFGIQQFCEGFLWLSLSDSGFGEWQTTAKYTFLIFAQVIWPFAIPLAFLLIEPLPERRRIMRFFLFGGIFTSLLLTYRLLFYMAYARIDGCHIEYDIATDETIQIVTGFLYLSAIVIAPFLSSWKFSRLLASVNLVSLILTQLFFRVYFVSVWCFFAAVQSVIIVLIMREIKRDTLKRRAQAPDEIASGVEPAGI